MSPTVDVPALLDWVGQHREDMLADLAKYVEIETPSDDRACLVAGLSYLDGWVRERLGDPAAVREYDGGQHGDIRVYDFPGEGDQPLLLLCHYDTVWPRGTLAEWPFTVDGDTVTGPGVFDMKSGLVQAVWALRALAEAGLPRPPIRLVLNGDEEIGSPASRPVIEAEAAGTRAALVFEASADGAIKTARKGVGLFQITVEGVAAHAGLDPTKGVSAIDELARAVLALHALTDLDAGTSVNVGVVTGGTRSNVTAATAHGNIDIRVRSASELARVNAALAALRPHNPRATLTITGDWNRPVMERSPGTVDLYHQARRLATQINLDLRDCAVGGASDGNFVAALGLPVLDGFGAVGDGAEARHEHISIRGMLERTALAAALITTQTIR
ncbi:M20 family metallopeptidase [Goodfellowiella coeruleoviolacea]|uniref:Glutamate carboxypeptidase n=1 Tax=Goodfellowiella coeruleoviolacea TaxID=334858 RepID=A0AAE3KKJ3_9PSEU|nr:M20 family metallopeptidase [Goodfellowiella coeruleoviolacea]MCP2169429.1 glutamate carboxypeptidase [Goodfellowiella coeruleoviolacea]